MIQVLENKNRMADLKLLAFMSGVCFMLSLARFILTDSIHYFFLIWNLFLAFVPFAITSYVVSKKSNQNGKKISSISLIGLIGMWLVFFPNAPYILTDLFHLKNGGSAPIWFDLILILAYAWTGLIFGFMSLWDIEKIMEPFFSQRFQVIISVALLFLTGFGIYLGRYLRWNSWDVLTQPTGLVQDIADRFINPFHHPRTWGLTIAMGLFLCMIYFTFRMLRNRMSSEIH